ncbi:flagellar hook protein FlgE [Planctomicrobium sp. SH668]|uniref:flagellar hook protein FlgE n=1 Tax=Planctomicrobium sp. SH668 TaxID=3448126 RepID=UPI003F5B33F3
MANSLQTGISGLKSHQTMIEIVGNNLANLNTVAYKERSAIFSDLLYQTARGASSGIPGVSGGTNPLQIGGGSTLKATRMNNTVGNLQATGNALDLALQGDGYFVVNRGGQNVYTRAGVFEIDKSGTLVDSGTGFPVQRYGTVGELNTGFPSFQRAGNLDIQIPIGAAIPGKATQNIHVSGNLPGDGAIPQSQVLASAPWLASGVSATPSTLLNDLDLSQSGYAAGDVIHIAGTDENGAAVSIDFSANSASTVGDLVAAVAAAFPGAKVELTESGSLQLTSLTPGRSYMSLAFTDDLGNAGETEFSTRPMVVDVNGKAGEIVRGGAHIFDPAGGRHAINLEFERQVDGTWTMVAGIAPELGTFVDNIVEGITFNSDGTFSGVTGAGINDRNLSIQFAGQTSPQVIQVVMDGGDSGANALSAYSGTSSMSTTADGYGNGVLADIAVDGDGVIQGLGTNGVKFPIAQLAIGTFRNAQGLLSDGGNFYESSLSSGEALLGGAGTGSTGLVRSGQLEQSNVDIALEFTRLIVAQRGYSANSRTISVTNEVLQELTNLIR